MSENVKADFNKSVLCKPQIKMKVDCISLRVQEIESLYVTFIPKREKEKSSRTNL